MSAILGLVKHILSKGKFYSSGPDFGQRRMESLCELKEFCPSGAFAEQRRRLLPKNRYLKAWISEAAYLASTLRPSGGHLALEQPALWYIRVPKAASTALCRSMLFARFPELQYRSPSAEQINFLTDLHLQRSSKGYSGRERVITVVRNPYSRIVSVYRQFFEAPSAQFLYEDFLFGVFKKDVSFQGFLETLRLIPDRLKDQHLRPQHTFLTYYQQRNVAVEVWKPEEPHIIETAFHGMNLSFEAFNQSAVPYDPTS